MKRTKKLKLKVWNGLLMFNKNAEGKKLEGFHNQKSVSICAHSQKDAIALLEEYGHPMSLYEFRLYWSDCWGNSMDGVARERGVWVAFEQGVPTKIEPKKR